MDMYEVLLCGKGLTVLRCHVNLETKLDNQNREKERITRMLLHALTMERHRHMLA